MYEIGKEVCAHAMPVVYIMITIPAFKEQSSVWKASGMANRMKNGNLPLDLPTSISLVTLARELEVE